MINAERNFILYSTCLFLKIRGVARLSDLVPVTVTVSARVPLSPLFPDKGLSPFKEECCCQNVHVSACV